MFTSDIFGAKIFIFKQNFHGFILNKRKNLCILFSLILAFFFVGCSDFYQDMAGSSIEMSFKVPEKFDERVVVSRNISITNIVTYKLVVKLESKNEVLDKIEKNVCSGELVNLAFTNVKKGKTVKVSAQLFQEEECVYIGESDWINTSKGKNYVKVMLEEGELTSISAEYIGGYELYGVEVQKENFKVFANYKVGESIKSLPVDDFNVKNENSRCIGNVPHSITYPTNVPTGFSTTIPVPVKYQLNAEKLAITAFVDDIENTRETDSGSRLKIAQYTQNVQLFAKYDDTVYLYNGETDNPKPINILVNWASYSGGPSIGDSNTLTIQDESEELSQGLATYECTITPNANSEFIVGESVTKQYFVNVYPWEIALTKYQSSNPDGFDNKTLEGGVTYLPNLTNEAIVDGLTSSDVTYSVTGDGYSIDDFLNVIQAPRALTNEQKATIKASLNGKEIASLDVVVPAEENSGTSGGTTGGEPEITTVSDSDLTFDNGNLNMVVKSYEGLKTVAKIINGEIPEGEKIKISSSQSNGAGAEYTSTSDGLNTIRILLSDDIELDSSWTGIGTEGNPYNGIFNGDDRSIKYNGNSKPLFNNAGGTICKISSLVVNGELTSSEPYLGGIVSSFSGGTIENCVNNATITNNYSTDNYTATGGIVGYLDNAEAVCTIQSCVNLVSIEAKTYVGGIVGHGVSSNNAGQSVTVSKCINIGDISSNSTSSGAYQAGIMGGSSFNVSYQCISITDCLNKGKIVYNDKTSSGAGIVNVLSSKNFVAVNTSINAGLVNTTNAVMISDSTPTNSYWDRNVNSYANPDSFTGAKTTAELVNGETTLASTFSNWVFNADYSYPYPDIGSDLPGGDEGTTWETVLEALEVELTSGGGSSTYQIGDVYSENGTAMGVVFEVAEDNSYIKIVALKDLNTNYTWAGSGVFTKNDQPNAYDKNNGDLNLAAIKSYVEANSNYGITLVNDFKIFNYTSQFYQISESEKGEWYVPALNELKNVIQYQNDGKFNNENYTYISQVYSYWSSTLISGTTTAYYATTNNQEQSQSVQTSCYVRPVRKINLEV